MGQQVNPPLSASTSSCCATASTSGILVSGTNPSLFGLSPVAPGFLGIFGIGAWHAFTAAGTYYFTVPNNVTKLRIRVLGAGGGGGLSRSRASPASTVRTASSRP